MEVQNIILSLCFAGPRNLQKKEIAVITPWREQVWRIRARLRAVGLGEVDVGNVEVGSAKSTRAETQAYQGREFRVTVVSCVRSRSRFLPNDKIANMGLYNECKRYVSHPCIRLIQRFNVAITRAKELLIVVGNATLLKASRCGGWR